MSLTTFASFASLWLLPRLADFQRLYPDIDIRISASDGFASADDPELDVALRYCHPDNAPADSELLFGEVLSPVANPALDIRQARDLAKQTLIEQADHQPSAEYLSWRRWLREKAPPGIEPRGWIYLNYNNQQIQAALSGQGVALGRLALIADTLARGELVEPFGHAGRLASPFSYWLVRWPTPAHYQPRPEVQVFSDWLLAQAQLTRAGLDASSPIDRTP